MCLQICLRVLCELGLMCAQFSFFLGSLEATHVCVGLAFLQREEMMTCWCEKALMPLNLNQHLRLQETAAAAERNIYLDTEGKKLPSRQATQSALLTERFQLNCIDLVLIKNAAFCKIRVKRTVFSSSLKKEERCVRFLHTRLHAIRNWDSKGN